MIDKALLQLDQALAQTAEIERNQAAADDWGGPGAPDWQLSATVPCFLWWGTGSGQRIGGPDTGPDFTVDLNSGGMILPERTDVSAHDRIRQVTDQAGAVIAQELEILAVAPFEGLTEITFRKIS